ncbi:DUF1127 domain-containing protein [Bradyrhizobium commune]|uniref:DUF1127 domain-containing protein n=1 Tax=Bradyrhizobium commune TaxID=83627 RepID=A0A7S9H279_9BRAD|nr:DUF1127 domain-containing protein [Bradyrhizobium commune]QPF93751.1 DUF1127 domain-containing protein [Bradyrhizobium commune]
MSTIISRTGSTQPTASAWRLFRPLRKYLRAFQDWRERDQLRADLSGLNDRDLQDLGITRGEIDYVASHRSIDPRGVRSTAR